MKKVRHQFKGFNGPSVCNYHLFSAGNATFLVIEQLRETRTSITNRIEYIVLEVCEKEGLDHSKLRLVEYYPETTLGNQLIFETMGVRIINGDPSWNRLSDSEVAVVKNAVVPG